MQIKDFSLDIINTNRILSLPSNYLLFVKFDKT